MKNNRGFTLVELLAVITILALVAFVALEAIDSINKGNREKAERIYAQNIITSAIAYAPTAKYADAGGVDYEIRLPDIEYSLVNSEGIYYLNYFNSSSAIGRLLYWNQKPQNSSALNRQYSPVITCREGANERKEYFYGDGCYHVENSIEEIRISLDFLARQGLLSYTAYIEELDTENNKRDNTITNPKNNRKLDMNKSYVSIIMVSKTNYKVIGTNDGNNWDYEFDKDLLCKYDGQYLYCLFQCYYGDTSCVLK